MYMYQCMHKFISSHTLIAHKTNFKEALLARISTPITHNGYIHKYNCNSIP